VTGAGEEVVTVSRVSGFGGVIAETGGATRWSNPICGERHSLKGDRPQNSWNPNFRVSGQTIAAHW